ncbi:unnamed protein product [Peniophora sp. CBMAI 1063]|nr:unnamed protein product [Peniophora sp. CBMAI 1063]
MLSEDDVPDDLLATVRQEHDTRAANAEGANPMAPKTFSLMLTMKAMVLATLFPCSSPECTIMTDTSFRRKTSCLPAST